MVQKRILRLEDACRRAPKKMAVGSCMIQRMSHVEVLDAGELQLWIRPTSLGSSNVADCIKMALPGPRRDLGASTQTEEAEEAPNTGGNPQMTKQHPRRSQDNWDKESANCCCCSTTKEGPTPPENNSASEASQDRALGTWARLCTKDSCK
ncbi:hypothetical protein NDU88_005259 [Pleurodeles waltl]|uniref:Uncharacterized protein n=1 Tax=Pleurodeles waltl TaxID=8319 RepID=A0AAV7NNH4_PLEWA|nr:hypothetical protein NDU88_005259 [Pleurodeles waltl]